MKRPSAGFDSFLVWNVGYKELTSKVIRMQSSGRGSKFEILRRKSLVSLKYDGNCMTRVVDGNLQTQRCARWELRMRKQLVFQGY